MCLALPQNKTKLKEHPLSVWNTCWKNMIDNGNNVTHYASRRGHVSDPVSVNW